MAKEWFTLDELRGLRLAGIDAAYLRALARHYADMPLSMARGRPDGVDGIYPVAEFHLSILPEAAREDVRSRNIPDGTDFAARARKLGINRPVADPRGVYVGPDVGPQLSQLERMLELHRPQGVR
jgi:hypothetical protein